MWRMGSVSIGTLPFHLFVCNVQRMATHIIGLMGRKGSGKDTFAQQLVQQHGFTRVGFADPLKAIAAEINPTINVEPDYGGVHMPLVDILDSMSGWDGAKQLRAVRELLQNLGVAVRDYLGDDAWIRAVANRVALVPGPVVVTDVRFVNEADWIVYTGGTLVRILRPGLDDSDTHISETALDTYQPNAVVTNNGDIHALHHTADHVVETMREYGLLPALSAASV